MKFPRLHVPVTKPLIVFSLGALSAASTWAAPIVWTGATSSVWTNGTNWNPASPPGAADTAVFDSNSTANLATTLGAPFSILGVTITTPSGPVSIGGPDILTLAGGGIDLGIATRNLTITAPVSLGADQTWTVAGGRVLTVSGGLTRTAPRIVSVAGLGQVQLSGAMSVDQFLVGNGVAAGEVVFSGSGSVLTQAGTGLGLAVGTANGSGTATFTGGTYTFGGDGYGNAVRVGGTTAGGQTATGTMTVSGAAVKIGTAGALDASLNLGVLVFGGTAANGTLNVSSGSLEVGRRILMAANGTATTAVVNLSGTGEINMRRTGSNDEGDLGMLRVGAGTTTINLNGGTLIASAIHTDTGGTTRTFINYNGATVRANVATGAFVTAPGSVTQTVKTGGLIFDTTALNVTLGGALLHDPALGATADGGLTKTGQGVLTLTGASTYTGSTNVNQGTLAFGGGATLASGVPITVGNLATLRFDRTDTFGNNVGANGGPITVNGGAITNGNNSFNALGAVTLNGGAINSTGGANGDFPSFSLKGPITVGGSTASIISGSGTNSQMLIGGLTANSQTTFTVANATGNSDTDLTVSVPFQNGRNAAELSTGLIKAGPGTMDLQRVNTYTGATTITGGALLVSGAGSIATSSGVTVASGGKLGGNGTVSAITLQSDGVVAPGNSIGTLTGSSLTWNPGGIMAYELSMTNSTSDLLSLSGGFNGSPLAGVFRFDFLNTGFGTGSAPTTYTLVNFGSTNFAANASNFSYGNLNGTGNFLFAGNSLLLVVTPEPGRAALLGIATLLMLGRRRRM